MSLTLTTPRAALTLAATTAALALVPAADEADARARKGAKALRLAAAVAAKQPAPTVDAAPYRYTRVRHTFTYGFRKGDRVAYDVHEQTSEAWVGAAWKGREIAPAGRRWQTGDPALAGEVFPPVEGSDPLTRPFDRPFAYGDGPLATLDPRELPADRDEIARVLNEGIRTDRWGPYAESRGRPTNIPEHIERPHVAYSMVLLLVYARLTPDQRAALLDALAASFDGNDLGAVTDAAGRQGRGVELAFSHPPHERQGMIDRIRIVFDKRTAEVREWSMTRVGEPEPGGPTRHELVLATGWAQRIGAKPFSSRRALRGSRTSR